MAPSTQAHNIFGNCSGNQGNGNAIGSNNVKVEVRYGADSGVQYQDSVPGAGETAPRPPRGISYCRNSEFVNRGSLIEEVKKKVSECLGHNRVALCGLGGSGKTQIALEYVHQRATENDCNIFWVHGSGVSQFSKGFKAIAQHVRIPLDSTETDEARLLEVKRWFEGPESGTWILVIDNADNEADFAANDSPITKFIPQTGDGTLIFTTRSLQIASQHCTTTIEVGKMEEEEALKLFSIRFKGWGNLDGGEQKDVAEILRSVHHLPLAVVGSADYMNHTKTSPSDYWKIFQENEERMKDLLSQEFYDRYREAKASVLSTYIATFTQIRKQMPLAADLLRLMAFFNHKSIPEELLTQYGMEGMDHSVNFRCAIGKLLGFSLVTMVRCGCKEKIFYDLDRLVQLSLQRHLPMEELDQGRAAAVKVISRLFPESHDKRLVIGRSYIPHACAVIKNPADRMVKELSSRVEEYLDLNPYQITSHELEGEYQFQ